MTMTLMTNSCTNQLMDIPTLPTQYIVKLTRQVLVKNAPYGFTLDGSNDAPLPPLRFAIIEK